jgi:hypothetical protein
MLFCMVWNLVSHIKEEHRLRVRAWDFNGNEDSYSGILGYDTETLVSDQITTQCHNPVDHDTDWSCMRTR